MNPYVILSHKPWKHVPTRTQQLVSRLKNSTIYFFELTGTSPKLKSQGKQVRPHIFVYTLPTGIPLLEKLPLSPFSVHKKHGHFISQTLADNQILDPILWVTHPHFLSLTKMIAHEGLIYDCDRDWSHLHHNGEGELANNADVVFAGSPWLMDRLSPCANNITLLPNGVNYAMYCQENLRVPPEFSGLPHPIAGFVGEITDDLDLSPILHSAQVLSHWNFLLIGKVISHPDLVKLKSLPNVHFLGHRPMTDIPDYLNQFDVCLDLQSKYRAMDDVVPTRVYEYLSTGKPIVSLLFHDQIEAFPDVVYSAKTLDEFTHLCQQSLKEDRSWVVPRRKAYGKDSAWSLRANHIQDILNAIAFY